jgi:hypothetical protein
MKHLFYTSILLLLASCNNKEKEKTLTYEDYQLHAANMIAQPKYSGDSMLYKLTGAEATLERFYVDTKKIIFSCQYNKLDEVLNKLAIHKDSVTVNRPLEEKLAPTASVTFEMFTRNLKIDISKFILTQYQGAVYRITLPQIIDFVTMKSNLRGGAFAITPNKEVMISHGVAVSKKGEPSLTDLVRQLTQLNQPTEVKAQQLLSFVANQIEYNEEEAVSGTETIKRPDEILFTRNSDCSGKTILYASLLQQINCKWCILYYDRHVCIGVAGNFKPMNTASVELKGVTYYIAETTAPNAVVGENVWGDKMIPSAVKFYQIPEDGPEVMDYISGEPLAFIKRTATEE